ncbi:hypothetical protein ACI3PL_31765, partial [Lacticaseibacillus paracasei]
LAAVTVEFGVEIQRHNEPQAVTAHIERHSNANNPTSAIIIMVRYPSIPPLLQDHLRQSISGCVQ